MQDGREHKKKEEESVPGGRRIKDPRLHQRVFEAEGASAGDHG
jgi:hypothetical protein